MYIDKKKERSMEVKERAYSTNTCYLYACVKDLTGVSLRATLCTEMCFSVELGAEEEIFQAVSHSQNRPEKR